MELERWGSASKIGIYCWEMMGRTLVGDRRHSGGCASLCTCASVGSSHDVKLVHIDRTLRFPLLHPCTWLAIYGRPIPQGSPARSEAKHQTPSSLSSILVPWVSRAEVATLSCLSPHVGKVHFMLGFLPNSCCFLQGSSMLFGARGGESWKWLQAWRNRFSSPDWPHRV